MFLGIALFVLLCTILTEINNTRGKGIPLSTYSTHLCNLPLGMLYRYTALVIVPFHYVHPASAQKQNKVYWVKYALTRNDYAK